MKKTYKIINKNINKLQDGEILMVVEADYTPTKTNEAIDAIIENRSIEEAATTY